jgi:hypothetical protein
MRPQGRPTAWHAPTSRARRQPSQRLRPSHRSGHRQCDGRAAARTGAGCEATDPGVRFGGCRTAAPRQTRPTVTDYAQQ